jgi:hypothetical protein
MARHAMRRRWLPSFLIAVAVIAGLAALSWLPASAARARLDAGRTELVRGGEQLASGDADGARLAFERAASAFRAAGEHADHPLMRLGGLVPLAGRSYDAIGALAAVGEGMAAAGSELARGVAGLPDGLASLAPSRGRVPVTAIRSLIPAVARARAELEAAGSQARAMPTTFLIGPVASAADLARDELAEALDAARAGESLLRSLPSFAGEAGTRRYFVAAQSPAELRGTGGFIGSFAILTAREGRLSLGPFSEISDLANVPAAAATAPSEGFREIYDRFGGAGFWRNLNITPDAPTAGSLIEALYERVQGQRLDGTIFVDPEAVSFLLEATGPVRVPILDRTLTASGVVDYLANRAYDEFGYRASLRKRVLGIAVSSVWDRFLRDADPETAVRSLVGAAAGGHLVLHAADPQVQAAFETAEIAGQLGTPRGDLFGVYTSNAAGNKVDYFAERDVRYEVSLGPGGTASAEASITFVNGAPAGAKASYALGPYPGTGLGAGDAMSFLSVYCGGRCEMSRAAEDGVPVGMEVHSELGFRSLSRYLRVNAQESRTMGLSLQLPDAWEGDEIGGVYRLRIQSQPTIRPPTGTVVIRVPAGMRIVHTSAAMQIRGNEATWRGTIGRQRDFLVRFHRPLPGRMWAEVWRVLT